MCRQARPAPRSHRPPPAVGPIPTYPAASLSTILTRKGFRFVAGTPRGMRRGSGCDIWATISMSAGCSAKRFGPSYAINHARLDIASPKAPRIPPDPQLLLKTRSRNAPARHPASDGCDCRTRCVPCRTTSMCSGHPDPPKEDVGATKMTDSAWETRKTLKGRYRASHNGRRIRTAHAYLHSYDG